jgi:hypothetical protein
MTAKRAGAGTFAVAGRHEGSAESVREHAESRHGGCADVAGVDVVYKVSPAGAYSRKSVC